MTKIKDNRTVNFLGINCKIIAEQYQAGGRVALQLIAAQNDKDREIYKGEPITTATVNIPCCNIESDEILIKNYSENEGLLEILENAGIVKSTGKYVESGWVQVPVCKYIKAA